MFLGYFDGATQFAQSCRGGGSDSSLPWGCKDDEDDRRFAFRCIMQAHKMLKPTLLKQRLLQEVKSELLFSEDSIKVIAERLNFSAPNHLMRFFKLQTGKTVGEFIEEVNCSGLS